MLLFLFDAPIKDVMRDSHLFIRIMPIKLYIAFKNKRFTFQNETPNFLLALGLPLFGGVL